LHFLMKKYKKWERCVAQLMLENETYP